MYRLYSITGFICLTHLLIAQNYFQDTAIFSPEIGKLERLLFPGDDHTQETHIFEGCTYKELDRIRLVQRVNRPNPDTLTEQIRKIFFLKDSAAVGPLLRLYHQYLEYFQLEWGWAIIKNRGCYFLRKERDVIEAFERAIFGLKTFPSFDSQEEMYDFVIRFSNAKIIPIYYWMVKLARSSDSLSLIKSFGATGIEELGNYTSQEIQEMKELSGAVRASEYTKYIHEKYNMFGASSLEWNIFTPYILSIKDDIREYFNQYSQMSNKQSLSYHLANYFFKVQMGEFDYSAINISEN